MNMSRSALRGTSFTSQNGLNFVLTEDVNVNDSKNQIITARTDSTTGAPTFYAVRCYGSVVSGRFGNIQVEVGAYERYKRVSLKNANIAEIISVFDSDGNEYFEVDNLSQDTIFEEIPNVNFKNDNVPSILKPMLISRKFVIERSSEATILQFGSGDPAESNVIEFITLSTTGNAQDFGDLTQGRRNLNGFSSQTRGLAVGGGTQSPATILNIIDFITIASAGNATDFGDTVNPISADPTAFSSPTRGVIAGGESPSPLNNGVNVIQFVTIASTGNTTDFGDLTTVQSRGDGASSQIRGVIYAGKRHPSSYSNTIEFVTIATTGNGVDFGDARVAVTNTAATSNSLRAVFGGGYVPGSNIDDIHYLEIQSQGNSVFFGELTSARREFGASSEAHGGLD